MESLAKTADIMQRRLLVEQLAYAEIREYLAIQYIRSPVEFMRTHGKRPEDLDGSYLRSFYHTALAEGIEVRTTSVAEFKKRFQEGLIFPKLTEQAIG